MAVKIIRAIPKYKMAARMEILLLKTLLQHDEQGRHNCVRLLDSFDVMEHKCMSFELLSVSVFDFLKSNSYHPFSLPHIQHFARQLFDAVGFLHGLTIVHTDIKPENILLVSDSCFTETSNIGSSSKRKRGTDGPRVLENTQIKLVDFGSATFDSVYHAPIVSTRHYRAPEVILGIGWSYPCDVWSLGCILVELLTGEALFQTHEDLEHLAIMEKILGRIPTEYLSRCKIPEATESFFTISTLENGSQTFELCFPDSQTKKSSEAYVQSLAQLADIIKLTPRSVTKKKRQKPEKDPETLELLEQFRELVAKCLEYDSETRITAREALQLQFVKQ